MLPPEIGCTREARDIIMNCCIGKGASHRGQAGNCCLTQQYAATISPPAEFIHLVAFEASDICDKSKKRTIGQEHVMEALRTLGFESYIPEVAKVVDDAAEEAKVTLRSLATGYYRVPLNAVCAASVCNGGTRTSSGGTPSAANQA